MKNPWPTNGSQGSEQLLKELIEIVGKENVLTGQEQLASYFPRPADTGELVVAQPATTEEVQQIVKLAAGLGMPVRTLNDRFLRPSDEGGNGVVLDFCRMTAIERLDKRNLLAHVQRGLTFDRLKTELDAQGLKFAPPLAATSDSILCNYINRAPLRLASSFCEVHVNNMQVVLADGTLFKTGSHALNEEAADLREDGGPSLSRWFFGSDDIFGIITRATIWIYPKAEARNALLFAFDQMEEAVSALRDLPRTEKGLEYLVANRRYLADVLDQPAANLPAWTLVVGFEGRQLLVDYQMKKVTEMMAERGVQPTEEHRAEMALQLDQVWYQGSPLHTGFYSPATRIKEFDDIVAREVSQAGLSGEDVGHCILSIDRSRSLYSQYDIYVDPGQHKEIIGNLEKALVAKGAFFDRPQGETSDMVIGSVPNLAEHLRTIKSIMDPDGIFNPGRFVSLDGPAYTPLAVELVTEEDTGIDAANIKNVTAQLKEAIGDGWVSDNPVDLSSYGRDFTTTVGEKPNIVVLPETTEDVQKIMRIGYATKIPVVPVTTGFNHGGLALPRKGGILVDLKRMNQLVEIDEESLTATFGPGVRMRTLWHECQEVETFKGIKLKPILPMTLASISLLSNYVSRGGLGSAVKYGGGPDLTVNMTWVLPNGQILKTGPSSVPGTEKVSIHWGPGPDIGGMFFNADGAFGICTEITVKLYPEMPCEQMISTAIFEPDPVGIKKACSTIYDLAQETLIEFIYKSHPGVMVVTLAGVVDTDPLDLISIAPQHPLAMLITGLDDEEIEVRHKLVQDVLARNEVIEIDPSIFGQGFEAMISTDPLKKSVGIANNAIGAYKGAFQWQAGYIKIEKVPQINEEYEKLIKKYWKTSDVNISMEAALTGTDLQGPLPFGRYVALEFDYWWDQGNPEAVKRASVMIRKTTELMIRNGCIPIRNMFGYGELLIPQLKVYCDILKRVRKTFDPANLMHPDMLPVTDDYV